MFRFNPTSCYMQVVKKKTSKVKFKITTNLSCIEFISDYDQVE